MIIRVGLMLLFLTCATTTEDAYNGVDSASYLDNIYNYLAPSTITKLFRKRETDLLENKADTNINHEDQTNNSPQNDNSNNGATNNNKDEHDGLSEGVIGSVNVKTLPATVPSVTKFQNNNTDIVNTLKGNDTKPVEVQALPKTNVTVANVTTNATSTEAESSLELNDPGVVKRGLIVFGGFTLLAVAYFIFYRRKNKKYDGGNAHNASDTNQFRYGVLQSDDRRDNLELSRIPLTMESDEDEDEDLEIFDLEQKKKSLSYVNLQTNDEDIVLHSSKDESKNNLLLDIEDGPSDTLINWSSAGNKSIL